MSTIKALCEKFEVASLKYAADNNVTRSDEWFLLKLQEELGELTQIWMKVGGRGRPSGRNDDEQKLEMENEAADLLGHVLLMAHRFNLDLDAAILRKWYVDPKNE